jgi:hypothetical protein
MLGREQRTEEEEGTREHRKRSEEQEGGRSIGREGGREEHREYTWRVVPL